VSGVASDRYHHGLSRRAASYEELVSQGHRGLQVFGAHDSHLGLLGAVVVKEEPFEAVTQRVESVRAVGHSALDKGGLQKLLEGGTSLETFVLLYRR
jgi:hypothetical protein